MFEKFRPLGDRVLVELVASEEKTASGLFIPDAAKEKSQKGVVVAVGTGRKDKEGKHIPLEVAVNDVIIFGKYSGTDLAQAGDNFLIIREDEILGILQK